MTLPVSVPNRLSMNESARAALHRFKTPSGDFLNNRRPALKRLLATCRMEGMRMMLPRLNSCVDRASPYLRSYPWKRRTSRKPKLFRRHRIRCSLIGKRSKDNPLAARRVREDILDAIRKLVPFPNQGHQRTDLASRPPRFQTYATTTQLPHRLRAR